MPELPEVETIVRGLNRSILGKQIVKVIVFWPNIVSGKRSLTFLKGDKFKEFDRHGKYIKILTAGGLKLIVHLRMTGQLFLAEKNYAPDKHVHIIMEFSDRTKLIYRDIRKFGRWTIVPNNKKYEDYINAGPDALSYTKEQLAELIGENKKKAVKVLLLDQTKIAGIGNIYADEICFRLGLRPDSQANKLDPIVLYKVMREVLLDSIKNQGTSFSDYRTSSGKKGNFQNKLRVYQQKKCTVCGADIKRTVVAGRSTHHCHNCQK